VAPAFYTDELDIDISGEEALQFMMRVWQVEMYKKVGIYFKENSQEYLKAKEDLTHLSSEEFARNYNNLSKVISDQDLKEDLGAEKYKIKINIIEAKQYLIAKWQEQQVALYGNYYQKDSIEYRARFSYLNGQYPREIQKMYFHSKENEKSTVTKKQLIKDIMKIWLEINNIQGSNQATSSSDYKVANRYYESLSKEKLVVIKDELANL